MAETAYAPDLESGFWEFESLSLYKTPLIQWVEIADLNSVQSWFEMQRIHEHQKGQ